jgi:hypothetical protein
MAALFVCKNPSGLGSLSGRFCAASEWTYIACEMANQTAGSLSTLHDNNDLGGYSGQ